MAGRWRSGTKVLGTLSFAGKVGCIGNSLDRKKETKLKCLAGARL